MRAHPKLIFLLLLCGTTAVAEQLYVDDKLVLNVYAEADQRSSRIATIQTGDAVEVIERVDKLVRVQLADGREGWVGASYLSEQPPAIVRLKELQSSADAAPGEPPRHLTEEIARLKKQNATLQTQVNDLKKQAKATAASPAVQPSPSMASAALMSATAAPPAHAESEPLPAPTPEPTIVVERSYWWAWALAVLTAGGAGFLAGYETLGRRVRQRFGGVKVY